MHFRAYFSNVSSSVPIATDQKVGGSSPSERPAMTIAITSGIINDWALLVEIKR
jgi:hypothetical protein